MATARVDPRKVKYPPESIIECLNEPSVTTAGQSIAKYVVDPFDVTLENWMCNNATANMDFIIAADGMGETAKIDSDSFLPIISGGVGDHFGPRLKIHAARTLECTAIMTAGGPTANVGNLWNLTVRKPGIVDKLRNDPYVNLTADETAIDSKLGISDNLYMGTISRHPTLLGDEIYKQFDQIIPVGRTLGVLAANSTTQIGPKINVPQEELKVLLGISIDTTLFAALFSDSYLIVDRDNDYSYMQLDLSAFPINNTVRCYIPFLDEMTIKITSVTGVAAGVGVMYFIGTRPMTVSDHLRWGIPAKDPITQRQIDEVIASYPDLVSKIKAGTL